ncbi:hypothetical protein ACPPVT_08745 [Angustibacter sp. McL0619]|uniref:hypothetical protein n=1 Tax=Angustibacter sp. McL0619 TaxID=3415676 RepID=UPI003CEF8D79
MADYSIDTNVSGGLTTDLAGLDDMKLTLDGGTTTTLAGGTSVNTKSAVTSESKLHTDSMVVADTKVALAPLQSSVDLRPVAVDSCVRLELAPPPPTEVCTPYEQRWGWSVLGLELFALSVSGQTSTHVRPDRACPIVVDL